MYADIFRGILIPFLGTALGAACVFFMKRTLSTGIQRALTGFAAGIMTAASVWSLLIPAMEQSAGMGKLLCMVRTTQSCKKRHGINYSDRFYIRFLYAVPFMLS